VFRVLPVWLARDGRAQGPFPLRIGLNDWYLFTQQDTRLHPRLLEILAAHAAERPEIEVFYADEVIVDSSAADSEQQICKSCFDRTQIIAQDYIGWPILVRGNALKKLGGPDPAAGTALTYDLILRALSEGIGIERIPEVFAVHDRTPSAVADRAAALERWRQRSAPGHNVLGGMVESTFQLQRSFLNSPSVTLVVPTQQRRRVIGAASRASEPMIIDFLESLCRTRWPMDRLCVLVGDDVVNGRPYETRHWPFQLERTITTRSEGEGFNYAAKMNHLWPRAASEYVVFMNDDLVVQSPDWLLALMTFAVNEEIGGVGARLLYPDNTIQHVGMPAGVFGAPMHIFRHRPASLRSYQNWAEVHREWSMVTGAVFATRKSVLRRANGFDEQFSLDFTDVDLCLRLRLLGYRIVYTPFAELVHFESASRAGMYPPARDIALFMERWRDLLRDDPAYHPRLTRQSHDSVPTRIGNEWWAAPASTAEITGTAMLQDALG